MNSFQAAFYPVCVRLSISCGNLIDRRAKKCVKNLRYSFVHKRHYSRHRLSVHKNNKVWKIPRLETSWSRPCTWHFLQLWAGHIVLFFPICNKAKTKIYIIYLYLAVFFSVPKRVALRPLHYILRHYSYLRTFSSPLRRARVPFIWKCTYHASQVTHAKSCPLLSYVSHQKSSSINFDFRRQSKIDVQTFMNKKNDFLGNLTYLTYKS